MNSLLQRSCMSALLCPLILAGAHAQTVSGNAFNPALSVILDGQYAHYSRDPAQHAMSGFLLGSDVGLAPQGLSLGESELVASANVDNYFYGQLTAALESSDSGTEVGVEEAFVQTTTLPAGLTGKFGRFFSDIGYLNGKHAHVWDFADQPLIYAAFLGNQYGDDGVQLRWVAPSDLLIEVGGEAFRGVQFPAAGAERGGVGAWTLFGHVGGDVGTTTSWRAGLSYLNVDALKRESALPNADVVTFSGSSDLWIADFVWKWAAHGNPKSRHLILQGEYMRRKESGDVVDTNIDYATAVFPPPFTTPDFAYAGTQSGFYVQAIYQFMPRWRVGARYDHLTASNQGPNLGVILPLADTHDPTRLTVMGDFSNSEFSRVRLQYAADKSQAQIDHQWTLQYVMSLGAHGAHQY